MYHGAYGGDPASLGPYCDGILALSDVHLGVCDEILPPLGVLLPLRVRDQRVRLAMLVHLLVALKTARESKLDQGIASRPRGCKLHSHVIRTPNR